MSFMEHPGIGLIPDRSYPHGPQPKRYCVQKPRADSVVNVFRFDLGLTDGFQNRVGRSILESVNTHQHHSCLYSSEILAWIEEYSAEKCFHGVGHHFRGYHASRRWISVDIETQIQALADNVEVCVWGNVLETMVGLNCSLISNFILIL